MDKPSHHKPPFRLLQPWNRIPELQHLPETSRFEIWERANAASKSGCLIALISCTWLIFILNGFINLEYELDSLFEPQTVTQVRLILIGVTLLFGPVLMYGIQLRAGRASVRRWLVKASHQRLTACIHCGYSLVGTPDDATHCPECGETVPQKEAFDQSLDA